MSEWIKGEIRLQGGKIDPMPTEIGKIFIREKMEWIRVNDKLPDYGQEVLFVNGKNEVSVGIRFPYQEGADVWSSENSIYFNDSILQEWATCKYWMQLPEAPKHE